MVSVDENAAFGLIIKIGAKINSTHYMPAPLELLLICLLYMLCSVLQIHYFPFEHLRVNILSYLQSVFFHFHIHVAKFNISGNLQSRSSPVFWETSFRYFFIINDFLFVLIFIVYF